MLKDPAALEHCSAAKRHNRVFVLACVQRDGRSLLFADPHLQSDREVRKQECEENMLKEVKGWGKEWHE